MRCASVIQNQKTLTEIPAGVFDAVQTLTQLYATHVMFSTAHMACAGHVMACHVHVVMCACLTSICHVIQYHLYMRSHHPPH